MENDLRQGPELMPCGHPPACVVIGEQVAEGQYAQHCGWCADLHQLYQERLELLEICHALAEHLVELNSQRQQLREALKDALSGSSELWNRAMEAASHLYETWAKYGTGDGATETALEVFIQAWDEMLE